MSRLLFVVMTNDYPDCVFSEEWKAKIYCELQTAWQKELLTEYQAGMAVYYRYYPFTMDEPGGRFTRRDKWGNQQTPTKHQQEEFRASLRAAWEKRRGAVAAGS